MGEITRDALCDARRACRGAGGQRSRQDILGAERPSGEIEAIEAVFHYVPYRMPSPWADDEIK